MPCTITINTHALDICSIGDRDVRKYLQERYGIADSIKVQELEKEKRNEIILSCLEIGTGLRQLSRLTGVTYGVINKLNRTYLKK